MKGSRILWIMLLAIVLAACCCAVMVGGLLIARGVAWSFNWADLGRVEAATTFERTFSPGQPVSLELDIPLGDVTIQAAAVDGVAVVASLRAWGRTQAEAQAALERIDVQAVQEDQRVRVETAGLSDLSSPSSGRRTPEIKLLITVPLATTLTAETEVGRLTVSGLRGDVAITAGVGEVVLQDVVPMSRIEIWSRVGNIELRGPLAAGATYDLASDIGRIALWLPRESSFAITARSDLGTVELGFPLMGNSQHEGVGREVRGEVGAAPTTTLTLRSRVGAISVQPSP